ncbi:hypothetical protein TNCT_135391 [Trichonephila clavata]|uniref:Uncharacterized protein n=1 Tax=Trichonephila clavata TaxID=2740835 RepID=A0A8X6GK67_TRICU|nr:hypothetical protein TNCT_135391 [Trichonephila clavata]
MLSKPDSPKRCLGKNERKGKIKIKIKEERPSCTSFSIPTEINDAIPSEMTEKILNQEKRKQPQIDNRFIDQVSRTETRDGLEK